MVVSPADSCAALVDQICNSSFLVADVAALWCTMDVDPWRTPLFNESYRYRADWVTTIYQDFWSGAIANFGGTTSF